MHVPPPPSSQRSFGLWQPSPEEAGFSAGVIKIQAVSSGGHWPA